MNALRWAGFFVLWISSAPSLAVADDGDAPTVDTSTSYTGPNGRLVVVGEPLPKGRDGKYERVQVPDVDGRPPKGPTVGESLLWVPRVVFFPVYVVTEYVIRRPVGWLLTTAERQQWPALFIEIFTFGENRNFGIVPTAFVEFNFQPSIGVYMFGNDVFVDGHDIRANASFGGIDWLLANVSDRWALTESLRLDLGFFFESRPDHIFHGLGPDSLFDDRSRYQRQRLQGSVGLLQRLAQHGDLRLTASIEESTFDLEDTAFQDDDPSLREAIRLGFFEAPAGTDGYFVLRSEASALYDTRTNLRRNGNGATVRATVQYAADLNERGRREWVTTAGGLSGHLDLGHNRILTLAGFASNTFRLGAEAVPFTELPTSGWQPLVLGAYMPGRLTGNSIAVASLDYRYEVWALIDGHAFLSLGNVFGEEFDGLTGDNLRISYGLGFASVGDPDASFNFLLGFGHETFEQGSGLDTVRLLLGFQPSF
ncbi:MAG: BamA/TamA family outer membrane protein [Myxococcales bacterium]|nr:BamA/TamA family outer membrane protein [Myxococcales bacterium]